MPKQISRFFFVLSFMLLGALCEILFWATGGHVAFILALSPVLYLANWLEGKITFLSLPAVANELVFVLPVNLLYFGLMVYWLKQVSEENGLIRIALILAILVLIVFIHSQAALGLGNIFPLLEGLHLPETPLIG